MARPKTTITPQTAFSWPVVVLLIGLAVWAGSTKTKAEQADARAAAVEERLQERERADASLDKRVALVEQAVITLTEIAQRLQAPPAKK